MRKIEITISRTDELDLTTIKRINELKSQHWKYTMKEHMLWFQKHIKSDDNHILICEGSRLFAYLNLVHINVEIDKQLYQMFGIGNVCVSKEDEGIGTGTVLMSITKSFLKSAASCGLVLCNDRVLTFYERNGWKRLQVESPIVEGLPFDHCVMLYDPINLIQQRVMRLDVSRSF